MAVFGGDGDPAGRGPSVRDAFLDVFPWVEHERPEGPEWDKVERLVGPDVCWAIWFNGKRIVTRCVPGSDSSGTPKTWHAEAERLEKAARELRALMQTPAVRHFARTHVYRKREGAPRPLVLSDRVKFVFGPRAKAEDASDVRSRFDALPELLDLFVGLADAVKAEVSIARGAPPDELKRELLHSLVLVFHDYGLPVATGGNSKLPKVAKLAFAAFGIGTDPRTLLRKMTAEWLRTGFLMKDDPAPGRQPKIGEGGAASLKRKREWFDV